jgi:hypothetical protein
MIPALRGLSNLHVSFGSATDVSMAIADSMLGKRPAGEEEEVQGAALDLSLGLTYGGMAEGGTSKKGRKHIKQTGPNLALGGRTVFKPTEHVKSSKQARPHVWTRQEK